MFKSRDTSDYNLKHASQFTIPRVNSVYHGTEFASFWGQKFGN